MPFIFAPLTVDSSELNGRIERNRCKGLRQFGFVRQTWFNGRNDLAFGNATSIDEVIANLDQIVEDARRDSGRYGFFASLYGGMTRGIKSAINAGRFDDPQKVTELDVVFANRYFVEFDKWRAQQRTSQSWKLAFASTERPDLLILQHLLLGMNAHINFDLGISTAEVVSVENLEQFHPDYLEINQVIAELSDAYQARINQLSPWFGLIDWLGARKDEAIFNFSIEKARDWAWEFAKELSVVPSEQRKNYISSVDSKIWQIANLIVNPGALLNLGIRIVGFKEVRDVRTILEVLQPTSTSSPNARDSTTNELGTRA